MAARNTVMGEGRKRRSQMKFKKRADRETGTFFGGVISKDKRLEDKIRYEEYLKAKEKYEAKNAAKAANVADQQASDEDSSVDGDPLASTDLVFDQTAEMQHGVESLPTT